MRSLRFLLLAATTSILASCGGSLGGVDEPTQPPVDPATPRAPNASSDEAASPPSVRAPLPSEACRTQPVPVKGTASCDVARDAFVVEAIAVRWSNPDQAWRSGAVGTLQMRFRNEASNSAIHYPGVSVLSPDARVDTDAETHADGYVHPDLYMIASCTTEPVAHAFTVRETLPSGTTVRFVLSPVVATGDGIASCGGTLRSSTFDVVVP